MARFCPVLVTHQTSAGSGEESVFSTKAAFKFLQSNLGNRYHHLKAEELSPAELVGSKQLCGHPAV
jgi:hypothetical protein